MAVTQVAGAGGGGAGGTGGCGAGARRADDVVRAVVPGEAESIPPLRPADSTGRALWKSPPRSARIQNFVDQRSEVFRKGFCSAGRSRNSSGKPSEP
jgi:hypothetical protein